VLLPSAKRAIKTWQDEPVLDSNHCPTTLGHLDPGFAVGSTAFRGAAKVAVRSRDQARPVNGVKKRPTPAVQAASPFNLAD